MTWRGREVALPCRTIEQFKGYLQSLNFSSWRPSGMVVHNTASPTLEQWWHGGTTPEQRMKNLRNYYENEMGWSAGPHAFVDGVTMWIFTDFNVKGVHSPSWNSTRLGIEMVGDYDKESDESGPGLKVMDQTIALFGECHSFFGWEPTNTSIKLHKEDPATNHDCPGKNVVKSEFVSDVNQYMGDGGDHGDVPLPEALPGTVKNVPAGDRLNIRASASSSSTVIGTCDNGSTLKVVGSAYNGSTKWLRGEFGQGVLVYGWVSSDYVDVAGKLPEGEWHTNITATRFGGGSDSQDSAYPDIDWITSSTRGVALPYKWKGERPRVIVSGPNGEVTTDIVDLGPWNYDDPNYVLGTARPLAETQYYEGTPAQNGRVPVNNAGIDLTDPIAREVGTGDMGKVKWKFAEPQVA